MNELPHGLYFAAGFILLTNLSTVGAILRAVWWIAKADSRLEQVEKDLNILYSKHRAEGLDTQGS